MSAAAAKTETATSPDFVISRVFDAPRELVWKAMTEPERMKEWWGPKGFTVLAAKMDLRPGGSYLYGMAGPDGTQMWGKMVYREVDAPSRLVFINCFSDEAGGVTRHPMAPTWPLEMLTTITLAERAGRTTVTVEWIPQNASATERKTFDESHESMRNGWTGTFDQLAGYLAKS